MIDIIATLLSSPGAHGRMGIPAVIWGPPGVGKTARVAQACTSLGLHLETVLLSVREPADVTGLPVVTPEGVTLAPPAWAKRLAALGEGVLFLDELSCAAPAVQAAALRIVAEGVVGDFALPPGVRVIAAANPAGQAAGGWELAGPLANRLVHIDIDAPSPETWAAWLMAQGEGLAPRGVSPDAWASAWASTRAGVAALHSHARPKGVALLDVPESDEQRGRAWPSPRSWEAATRALASCRATGAPDSLALALLAGCVGEGQARAAWAYLSTLDLPDARDVLAGQHKCPVDRPDRAYAVLGAVVALARRNALASPAGIEERVRALEVASEVAARHADVAAGCIQPVAVEAGVILAREGVRVGRALSGNLGELARAMAPELRAAPKARK